MTASGTPIPVAAAMASPGPVEGGSPGGASSLADPVLRVSEIGSIFGEAPRGTSAAPGAPTPAAPPATATPATLAPQLAVALSAGSDGVVDIRLNPEELGRVRLSLSGTETALTLTITAERPETADLMRRNSEGLLREFRAMGYEAVTLAFGEGGGQSGTHGSGPGHADPSDNRALLPAGAEPAPPAPEPATPTLLTAAIGLDIRL